MEKMVPTMIKSKKVFFILFVVIVMVYAVFAMIKEGKKMNVMRWRNISSGWIEKVDNTKVHFSKENLLAQMESCLKVDDADVVFYFTPDISNYAHQSIFLIDSYISNFVLYKGQFHPQIILKGVPYCTDLGYGSGNDYDMLAFRLFDPTKQRAVFWGALQEYRYYNGKINKITLFRDHVEEYDGYYKVEQEDK